MLPPAKTWQIAEPVNTTTRQSLAGFSPVLQQILANRGISVSEQARVFLEALPPPGSDPFQLHGMAEAVDRILYAINHQQNIVIYGDYDADGVTATALLTLFLEQLGARVKAYIPNRFDEGYGLNMDAIQSLAENGAKLIITVDCGIRSVEEASLARRLGVDLVITDHHHPGDDSPDALAVINPKQNQCPYPDKNLAGVGLAYKLAEGLVSRLESTTNVLIELKDYLDLVAIGTVADMATLLGENRSLVKKGIQVIQQGRRQGILSLAGVAGLQPGAVTATEIGYLLGPRLNAAGRLETAQDALKLLMTADTHEAGILAQKLNNQNRERQDLTQKIQEHALQQAVARDPQALILFAVHPEYNPGVVGLAASRLTERYYRPAIVGHMDGQFVRASCRSIPEFHITNALDECANLLVRYGGHAAAAGFTAKNEDMPALIERLNSIARRELQAIELQPKLYADMVMELKDLKPAVLQEINLIQPTGIGNPPVLFVSRDLKVMRAWTAGKDAAHLKLTLTDGYVVFDGIGFRLGYVKDQLPSKVDVLYSFEVNEYNGNRNFQLNIKDIRASQG